jgi:excisionase family DNA binding protein
MKMKTTQESRPTPLAIPESDQKDIEKLYSAIQRSRAKLVGPDGRTQKLPVSLYKFLLQLIADLQEGKSVSIIQNEAKLTTVEAASLLGISRQFLVNLLDQGKIAHHKVGTHRRVYVKDVLAFKSKRDGHRRRILDDLVEAEIKDGLYDVILPPNAEHD